MLYVGRRLGYIGGPGFWLHGGDGLPLMEYGALTVFMMTSGTPHQRCYLPSRYLRGGGENIKIIYISLKSLNHDMTLEEARH